MNQTEMCKEMSSVGDALNSVLRRLYKVLDEADHEALIGYGGEDYCLTLARSTTSIRRAALDLGNFVED